ncbi:MAG TPA: glycosyltransferase family 39 protein [Blastocatellia bacterium]|nr:glycosyltransferase family 39 protein [Blastocatellia bacterium]
MNHESRITKHASRITNHASRMKLPTRMSSYRRWFASELSAGRRMRRKTKILVAIAIFLISFATKSLHAVDLAPVMYTSEEPLGSVADAYDTVASSILQGEGLLGPSYDDPRKTAPLARAPGYPIYLSAIYSLFGRDYFRVQLVQNALNSISPILIFLIAGNLLSWRVGAISGLLSAVSHHLSHMSNWILPDSISALFLLAAVYLLVIARRAPYSYWLYLLAGAMIGLSAWLRSLTLLFGVFVIAMLAITSTRRWQVVRRAIAMSLVSFLVIAPITIKNYLRYGHFVPINIQMGLVLWVGIADASGDRFGAVPDDNEVARQEATIYGNPEYGKDWSSPDGIERDRDRIKKSLRIIRDHPVWYAGVMLDRMGEMLKYSAHAPLVYGRKTDAAAESRAQTREAWQSLTGAPPSLIGEKLSWLRLPIRAVQRIVKETMLGFILLGMALMFLVSWRRSLFLLIVPLYHLLFQSFMHTEFRYGLPMHYFLFVFAAVVWALILTFLWNGLRKALSSQPSKT